MYDKSIGELLKSTREQKEITIEQVVQDTHISRRLIIAMEEERFDEFAGDTYLTGFLKNYAGYLDLDGDALIQRYRSLQMQEQPAPIAELLEKRVSKKRMVIPIVIALASVIGLSIAIFWQDVLNILDTAFFNQTTRDTDQSDRNTSSESALVPQGDFFPLTERVLERSFRSGNGISYTLGGASYYLLVEDIDTNVTLRLEDQIITLLPQKPVAIDVDNNQSADISVELKEILRGNRRAVIRFEVGDTTLFREPSAETAEVESINDEGTTTVASRRRSLIELGEVLASQPYPVIITARSPTIIHYQLQGQSRVERFLSTAETIEIEGNQEIQIWIANAGAVDFSIAENTVRLGAPGQVRVFAIRRTAIPLTNQATLQLVPFY